QVLKLGNNEILGLTTDQSMTPGTFRMMCYCVISTDSLGRAIERVTEFYATFFDRQIELYFSQEADQASLGYCPSSSKDQVIADEPMAQRFAYGLSFWHRFFGWLSGGPIALSRVNLTGSATARRERYERLFAAPVHFKQANDSLHFDAAVLKRPILHTEHSLREFLSSAPYPLLIMDATSADGNVSTQVKSLIGQDFSGGFPSFDAISSALGVSAPTLRRRLKREGTTFQQLKDEARCELSAVWLDRSDLSIGQVAAQLGFADPSVFHRSFKKWTGKTPGQFRAERQNRQR
ncbi:MAG: AraC family transcriptional regulator ligand-binding domain-containing protein, partial [Pseudomonadota bacterium]